MKQLSIVMLVLLFVAATAGVASDEDAPKPLIKLPEPTGEQLKELNWPQGGTLSNSLKAWMYNPPMIRPLLEVGEAVDDCALPLTTRRMLAAVVASRSNCMY